VRHSRSHATRMPCAVLRTRPQSQQPRSRLAAQCGLQTTPSHHLSEICGPTPHNGTTATLGTSPIVTTGTNTRGETMLGHVQSHCMLVIQRAQLLHNKKQHKAVTPQSNTIPHSPPRQATPVPMHTFKRCNVTFPLCGSTSSQGNTTVGTDWNGPSLATLNLCMVPPTMYLKVHSRTHCL